MKSRATILFSRECFGAMALAIGTMLSFAESSSADPLDDWTLAETGSNQSLNAVAYGDGQFVAVGGKGTMLISKLRGRWQLGPSMRSELDPGNADLMGIAFGAGNFVVAGGFPTCCTFSAYSTNGTDWVENPLPRTVNLLVGMSYAGGLFATYHHTGAFTSVDGHDWASDPVPRGFVDVAYGNGKFVSVGGSGIMVSENGRLWAESASPSEIMLHSIAYGNGSFVAVSGSWLPSGLEGTIIVSSDGLNWRSVLTSDFPLLGIAFGVGEFVAVGAYGTILTSRDGLNWTARKAPSGDLWLAAVEFGDSRFVAVGDQGAILESGRFESRLRAVARSREQDVTFELNAPVGTYTIEQSSDLKMWTAARSIDISHASNQTFTLPANTKHCFFRATAK